MLVLAIAAPVLGTNCYVVAPDGGDECVVVDPGIGVDEQLEKVLDERGLRPAGVLVTHGHLDHTFTLSPLCQRRDLPVYLHERDAYRLSDPVGTLGPQLATQFAGLATGWVAPSDVRPFTGDQVDLHLAGIELRAIHAPGHTEGSTLYLVPSTNLLEAPGSAPMPSAPLCFTGDVLFAGTIGRTDLPGGDDTLMRRTRELLARPEAAGGLPDATTVLPGHGESSTLGRERATNPYLRGL
ncbi:MBL fold metallo-hydrolase [Jiangella asiatica]|uniref:MBL fold metallo-hydrolase n=1 Tax=Jiangella asiatica TaxID=2530372 RepID=A0A4R5D9I2_9ACTN|nr:MBL fold metallo-hydrolase [Jiangella asiatica]TDE08580.1 MBL fold metallo-hydrolase [Jiangella asiatica]